MATGAPLPVREYQSADQLRRDAAALRARMFGLKPVQPPAPKRWAQPQVQEIAFVSSQSMPARRSQKNAPHPLVRLLAKVSKATGVTMTDIRSDRRPFNVVRARHIHYYVAKQLTTYSLPEIGRRAGGKDHTSVLHGVRRVQAVVDRLDIELPKSRFAMAKALWSADWTAGS